MSPAFRGRVTLVALAGLMALLMWGASGLPGFGAYPGPYGVILDAVAVAQRHATDLVTAVNFDYRGFDTVGEEFILFAAVAGVAVVLRHLRRERESPAEEASDHHPGQPSDAARLLAITLCGPTLLLGWYIASHGQISPGGGFQGGVVLATAVMLVFLAGQFVVVRRAHPQALAEAAESVGAGGFALIGLTAVLSGVQYLTNTLPLGSPATIASAGTMGLISFCVGVEVAAGMVLIVYELLDQTLLRRSGA